eukprot:189451-Rhodomonas_salina.1
MVNRTWFSRTGWAGAASYCAGWTGWRRSTRCTRRTTCAAPAPALPVPRHARADASGARRYDVMVIKLRSCILVNAVRCPWRCPLAQTGARHARADGAVMTWRRCR